MNSQSLTINCLIPFLFAGSKQIIDWNITTITNEDVSSPMTTGVANIISSIFMEEVIPINL
jgi:hypothetical protein